VFFFLFNRTTLQVFVTCLTGAIYVNPLWFYKHQHDYRVRSKLFVACQRWWFQWRFRFVPTVPGYLREEEEHKPDPWRNPIDRNHMGFHLENEVVKRVASDHHRSHARSIAAVNAGLKILWRVGGNGAGNQNRHWNHHRWQVERGLLSQPVHQTATYRCDDTRCCIIQFWPPDDEHIVLETCRGI